MILALKPLTAPKKTYGERLSYVDLGFDQTLPWIFIVADVDQCIIGADFLSNYDITVRPRTKQLTHVPSGSTVIAKGIDTLRLSPVRDDFDVPYFVNKLLDKYPDLTSGFVASTPVKHNVVHRIKVDPRQQPLCTKPRRLGPNGSEAVSEAIQKMLQDGTLRESSSPWSSALHYVPKRSGSWRFVGDYKRLNSGTKKDSYSLPYLKDFANKLYNHKVFSTVDLRDAYHQIPIAEEDIEKTALATPFGNFEYTRMSFGLCGAAQTFQRFIDGVMRNLKATNAADASETRKVTSFSYIDILIASRNEQEHREDLEALFERLDSYGLKINLNKCTFNVPSLTFLGHHISAKGTSPMNSKVQAIAEYEKPHTVQSL